MGCKRTVAYFAKRAAEGLFLCCVGVGTALLCAEGEVLTSMMGSAGGEGMERGIWEGRSKDGLIPLRHCCTALPCRGPAATGSPQEVRTWS